MTITAKIIADSVSAEGYRLTTFELVYPRMIHSEFMTHSQFSRNASSSRAIPVERQIKMILENPAMPIHWGKNQPGMQAYEELDWASKITAQEYWMQAMHHAVQYATKMHELGAAKQIVNRILEPFSHIKVICSSTFYANFIALRDHSMAMPEIRELAVQMQAAMNAVTPGLLKPGQWHLPYVEQALVDNLTPLDQIKVSVARCARVSYLNHDGSSPDIDADIALYDRLVGSAPLHASPCEHQARPDCYDEDYPNQYRWAEGESHGNFHGWIQYRKTIKGECVFDNRYASVGVPVT